MERGKKGSRIVSTEVEMVDPEELRHLRELHARGWGFKSIARELGISKTTVRRYVRGGVAAEKQVRPKARCLDDKERQLAIELLGGPAEGNAAVVKRLLVEQGVDVSLRTVQRAVEEHRQAQRAAEAATVRFETAPGRQMQIDFGEKRVSIAGVLVRVCLFVAVLSHSRRIFAKAFLSERQDDWREGLAGAFRHFGGLPTELLVDNARALIVDRDRESGIAKVHPAFAAFCADWGVGVKACRPYRARTKGKTESGVKFVKRNAVAGIAFASFAALEAHLARWCLDADERVHGTTHEPPRVRFERDERGVLRPLPANPLPVREQRLSRRVATDCFIDVGTIRYSVPHALIRRSVEVLVGEEVVRIMHRGIEVARHRRSTEPHARVVEPSHYDGLWRRADAPAPSESSTLQKSGRSLDDYEAVVGGGAS
jgi:transposase